MLNKIVYIVYRESVLVRKVRFETQFGEKANFPSEVELNEQEMQNVKNFGTVDARVPVIAFESEEDAVNYVNNHPKCGREFAGKVTPNGNVSVWNVDVVVCWNKIYQGYVENKKGLYYVNDEPVEYVPSSGTQMGG